MHGIGPFSAASRLVAACRPHTLLGNERRHRLGRRGFPLLEGGRRLRLGEGPEPLWLDLWEGDTDRVSVDEHRALGVSLNCESRLAPRIANPGVESPEKAEGSAMPLSRTRDLLRPDW